MRKRGILSVVLMNGTLQREVVLVIGETEKKYRILAERRTIYSPFGAFIDAGETALARKDQISFPEEPGAA